VACSAEVSRAKNEAFVRGRSDKRLSYQSATVVRDQRACPGRFN